MNIEVVIPLILLSVWDLWKQRLPLILLLLFSAAVLWQFAENFSWLQAVNILAALLIGGMCLWFQKRKKLGGGDTWILSGLALVWPLEVLWHSLFNGFLLSSIVSVTLWGYTQNKNEQIPLVPFLLLGYWVNGC